MSITTMNSEIKVYDKKPENFSPQIEVAATYVNFKGKLLFLQLASNKSEKGTWGVPAGKLEAEEKPVQGAKRELFEETGIDINSEDSFQWIGMLYIRKPEIDYVYYRFEVNLKSLPTIHLSKEHCSYLWVSREEAKNLPLMGGAKQALDDYYQHSPQFHDAI